MTSNGLFTNVEDERALAEAIVDTIREPLLVLNKDLQVVAAGRSLSVVQAEDGMAVAADHSYVILPNATLTIENDTLHVETPAPMREFREPIDAYFSSRRARF